MGLDSVELVMEMEKAFSIRIPDKDAEHIITVGDFHDSVWRHISGRQIEKCQSQILYYKLRKSSVEQFNIHKENFHLDANPNDVFPYENRRNSYLEFAGLNKLELPPLVLTRPWSVALNLFGVVAIFGFLIAGLLLSFYFNYSYWIYLLPVLGTLLTFGFSSILEPKRKVIKSRTIRDFIREVLTINYSSVLMNQGLNRKDMEMVMNQIIADKSGLEVEEISPEKKIGDDLGIS